MTAGCKIIGDSGTVQLDENYPNLQLVQKGSFTAGGGGSYGTVTQVTVAVTDGIIFLRANGLASCIAVSDSGANRTFSILANYNVTVNWYVFGRASTASTYGMNVYDASGNLTFSSDHLPLDVHGVYSTSDATPTGKDITIPSGTWAFAFSDPGVIFWSTGTGGGTVTNHEYWAHQLSGTTMTINTLPANTFSGIRDSYFPPRSIIMVDVTHA